MHLKQSAVVLMIVEELNEPVKSDKCLINPGPELEIGLQCKTDVKCSDKTNELWYFQILIQTDFR